jgi:ATP-dependent protease HslVU (ClpYQ) peptidase subunit
MTTIVADSDGMASDSGSVQGKAIFSLNTKKIFRIKGYLIGICGSCAQSYSIIHDLKGATDDPIKYLLEWSGEHYEGSSILILDPAGKIWCYDGHGVPYRVNEPAIAIGSGGTSANAALMAGATIKEAVKIAIALDSLSNGKLKYMKL